MYQDDSRNKELVYYDDLERINLEKEIKLPEEANTAQNILDALVYLAPFLQKVIPLDCMVGISDRERFLAIVPGKEIKPQVDITGQPVPRQEALYSAIRENRRLEMAIPKEVFGFEYKSCAVPVTDRQGKVIGGIGLGVGLENREKLINLAETVAVSSQETSETVKQLTAAAERLSKYQEELKKLGQEVAEEVNKTANILNFIHSVASDSNLLGLNAAIEAARAGEQGRGFAVVADEIRKMADNSEKAVKDIESILSSIHRKTEHMADQVIQTAAIGQEQLAATEEIFSAMEELAVSAHQLEQAAGKVVG